MQKDLIVPAPASAVREKLLSNGFSAFGVEYKPESDASGIRYRTERAPSVYFNSFALDLRAVVSEAGECGSRIRLEADLQRSVKVFLFLYLLIAGVLQVVLLADCLKAHAVPTLPELVPALLVVIVFPLFGSGKTLAFRRIEAAIRRICA